MDYLKIEKMPTFLCGLCKTWLPNAKLWRVVGMGNRDAGICNTCSIVCGLAERVAKREAEALAMAGGE
jgi:hypothetical protein